MGEWFVYQPSGQHVGPMSGATLARGVFEGRIPMDAHVARLGATSWQVVTNVAEVSAALASRVPPTVPSPPFVPPAPPPRATLPPAAQGVGAYQAPRVDVAPTHIASTMPSGARGPRPVEEAVSLTMPLLGLGVCFFLAIVVTLVGLVFMRHGESSPFHVNHTYAALVLAQCAVMVVPPRAAAYRFLGSILVGTAAIDGDASSLFPHLVNVLASGLMLRFMTEDRELSARKAAVFAWALVPGVALVVLCAEAFLFR